MKVLCKHCLKIHCMELKCTQMQQHIRNRNANRRKQYNNKHKEYSNCYNSTKWKKVREKALEQTNYMCAICLELGKYNYKDIQVHHLEKIKENKNKIFELDNLIPLCREHHNQVEGLNKNEIKNYIKLEKIKRNID